MIKNKTILITGCSSGLGKSLALKFLKNNNKVFCLGRSEIKNPNFSNVDCNLNNLNIIKFKLKKLIKTKNIDYIFLNAGILGKIDLATKINYKEIEEIFKINVFANKEIIDYLIKNKIKSKLIIGISSGAALAPKEGWFLYCTSKSAFKFLIEAYALENKGIKFLSLSPGLIKTKMQNQICKIDENKISSVKKFKTLNKNNLVPSSDEVAENIIKQIKKLNFKSGDYLDIRKK